MSELHLERYRIFDGLSDEQVAAIEPHSEIREYKEGDEVFVDGQPASHIFLVVEGRVDLRFERPGEPSSPDKTITSVRAGQMLGWSGLVHSPMYSLTACCATPTCRLIAVERTGLMVLFEKDPAAGYVVMSNLAEVISTRFRQLQEESARREGRHASSVMRRDHY